MSEKPGEKQFSTDMIDYVPEPGMTFRDIDRHIHAAFFEDLQGYEHRIVSVFYGLPGDHDFRIDVSTEVPDFLASLLFNAQLNGWLKADVNQELLNICKDNSQARTIANLREQIYDLPYNDHAALASLSEVLTYSYAEFLADIADDIFKGGIQGQLLWFKEVNGFEDHLDFDQTPLKTIGVERLKELVTGAREKRKAQVTTAFSIDSGYYQALKQADDLMDEAVRSFTEGNTMEGYGVIRSLHPAQIDNALAAINQTFPVEFIDTILEIGTPKAAP